MPAPTPTPPPRPAPPPAPTPTPTPAPTPTPPPANPDLTQARKHYRQGLQYFRQTRPSNPNAQGNLRAAAGNFRKAQRFLENAARQEPKNQEIQKLQVETNRFLYSCLKMQTL